jgi:hypothetical protein
MMFHQCDSIRPGVFRQAYPHARRKYEQPSREWSRIFCASRFMTTRFCITARVAGNKLAAGD